MRHPGFWVWIQGTFEYLGYKKDIKCDQVLTCRKNEVLENPSSTQLGYSRISILIQAHFWDCLEIACWYWSDLAIIQATELGLGRISLNLRQKCGFQENSSFSN